MRLTWDTKSVVKRHTAAYCLQQLANTISLRVVRSPRKEVNIICKVVAVCNYDTQNAQPTTEWINRTSKNTSQLAFILSRNLHFNGFFSLLLSSSNSVLPTLVPPYRWSLACSFSILPLSRCQRTVVYGGFINIAFIYSWCCKISVQCTAVHIRFLISGNVFLPLADTRHGWQTRCLSHDWE
jgi:hypothetical protein